MSKSQFQSIEISFNKSKTLLHHQTFFGYENLFVHWKFLLMDRFSFHLWKHFIFSIHFRVFKFCYQSINLILFIKINSMTTKKSANEVKRRRKSWKSERRIGQCLIIAQIKSCLAFVSNRLIVHGNNQYFEIVDFFGAKSKVLHVYLVLLDN